MRASPKRSALQPRRTGLSRKAARHPTHEGGSPVSRDHARRRPRPVRAFPEDSHRHGDPGRGVGRVPDRLPSPRGDRPCLPRTHGQGPERSSLQTSSHASCWPEPRTSPALRPLACVHQALAFRGGANDLAFYDREGRMTGKPDSDVLIVGGGLAGLPLALALAQGGLSVTVVDVLDPATATDAGFDGRVSAIALASCRMFEQLGVTRYLAGQMQPI